MNRRAQGMSINVVVIAAICLIILVILVLIVIKSGRTVTETAGERSCIAQGGTCKSYCATDPNTNQQIEEPIPNTNCAGTTPECCRYKFGG